MPFSAFLQKGYHFYRNPTRNIKSFLSNGIDLVVVANIIFRNIKSAQSFYALSTTCTWITKNQSSVDWIQPNAGYSEDILKKNKKRK
jgi:hypothetical protein